MSDKPTRGSDLLGLAPFGEAINTVADGAIRGAGEFLGRICLPAAEELGLYFKDKVSKWRLRNIVAVSQKAEIILDSSGGVGKKHVHPRIAMATLDGGSWTDQEDVQQMWAGLLATSCSVGGRDEGNLIFIHLLSQLTTSEARILNYACERAPKHLTPTGLIYGGAIMCELSVLQSVSGITDIHTLDRELDHLRSLDLITAGFDIHAKELAAAITPTALALNLFVRCQGCTSPPPEFFSVTKEHAPE